MHINKLSQANKYFLNKKYKDALKIYIRLHKQYKFLDFNIALCRKKIDENEFKLLTSPNQELHNIFIKQYNSAITLHVYYFDHLEVLLNLIDNLNNVALYITCPYKLDKKIRNKLNSLNIKAVVYPCDNLGMDVLPFLKVYSKYIYGNYSYVCKLHTKNKKSTLRSLQGDLLINSLIGTKEVVNQIINCFNNNNVGMIYTDLMTRSADYLMYANRNKIEDLYNLLDIKSNYDDWSFIAGTMFWAKVESLEILYLKRTEILEFFYQQTEKTKTGIDGTNAHAFERLFGLLPLVKGYIKKGLVYPVDDTNNSFKIRVDQDTVIVNENFRKLSIPQSIEYYGQAIKSFKHVQNSKLFDSKYYEKTCFLYTKYEMHPILHYLIYGVDISSNPSASFSTQFYNLFHSDIKQKNIHPWTHYITYGIKENRECVGNQENWEMIARREGYFDRALYEAEHDFDKTIYSAWSHYNEIGYKKRYRCTQNTPTEEDFEKFDSYIALLNHKYLYEKSEREVLIRNFINKDYSGIINLADKYELKYGKSQFTVGIKMSGYLRIEKYNKAKKEGLFFWEESKKKNLKRGHRLPLTTHNTEGNKIFEECQEKTSIDKSKKICIYTSLFGDFSTLVDPLYKSENIDYICFSDKHIESKIWDVRIVKSVYSDNNLDAKHYKLFPWKYLKEYDYSLFVDANTIILADMNILINKYLSSENFVMWKHPERSDLYDEAEVILQILRHSPTKIIEQVKSYKKDGLTTLTGLVEGSFIWRTHHDIKLKKFMDDWWNEIKKHSKRDQLSLIYLMWKKDYRPKVLPEYLGNARKNKFFFKASHKHKHIETDYNSIKKESKINQNIKMRDIVFVYSEKFKHSGSTIMRGEQLSGFIQNSILVENRKISYEPLQSYKNKILFLTKGILKEISLENLNRLKKDGNILLFDYVDDKPSLEQLEYVDVLIASSISGYMDYKSRFSNICVEYLTHHVDPRVENMSVLKKAPKVGYFGELSNTIHSDLITEYVDFCHIDTSKKNNDWLNSLSNYNIHYAIRRRRGIDGHKPFLKGFTAAHMDSNIIIQKSQVDALYYLGYDYPYLLNTDVESEIISHLEYVYDSYGSKEWLDGLERMKIVKERSSYKWVQNEFKQIIEKI